MRRLAFLSSMLVPTLISYSAQAQVLSVGDVILKQDFSAMSMHIQSDLANVSDTLFQTVVVDGVAKITSTQTYGYYRIVNIPLHNVTKAKLTVDRPYYTQNRLYAFYQYEGLTSTLWYTSNRHVDTDFGEKAFDTNTILSLKFTTNVNVTESFDNIVLTATEVDKSYVRQATIGKLGTICLPMAVEDLSGCGATFYKIAGVRNDAEGQSIVFEEVSALQAGYPYVFLASAEQLSLTMCGSGVSAPLSENGLYGTFDRYAFADDANFKLGEYYIVNSQNQIQQASVNSGAVANRAFVKISEVPDYNPEAMASGTRLLVLGADGFTNEVVEATGIEVLPVASAPSACMTLSGYSTKSPAGLCICNGKIVCRR